MRLTRQFDLSGKSGAVYRYNPIDEDRFLSPSGANFVIVEDTDDGLQVVYVGETDNLSSRAWNPPLEKVRQTRVNAFLLTRLNVTRAIRENELQDLIAQYAPPMNTGGTAAKPSVEPSPMPSPEDD